MNQHGQPFIQSPPPKHLFTSLNNQPTGRFTGLNQQKGSRPPPPLSPCSFWLAVLFCLMWKTFHVIWSVTPPQALLSTARLLCLISSPNLPHWLIRVYQWSLVLNLDFWIFVSFGWHSDLNSGFKCFWVVVFLWKCFFWEKGSWTFLWRLFANRM